MQTLSKPAVAWAGILESVIGLTSKWRPDCFQREADYRQSLLAHLLGSVPTDCRVVSEYRHAGTTTDLCVFWQGFLFQTAVFVEIKRDLVRKAECDRLIGQVSALRAAQQRVVIVLVGNTDHGLVGRLRDFYRDETPAPLRTAPMVGIVVIEPQPRGQAVRAIPER